MIVVPKTSASTDNPWFGLAKFAWSGYVLRPSLIHTRMHTHMQPFNVVSPPLQIRVGVQSLWCDLPQQTVLDGEPGPRERRCAI